MLLTPPPVDHLWSYVVRRHALVAGILVLSDAVSRLGLMPELSRAALSSLDTTGLKAPPTLYSDRGKLNLTASYISMLLGAMVRRQEDKTELKELKHQEHPSPVGQKRSRIRPHRSVQGLRSLNLGPGPLATNADS